MSFWHNNFDSIYHRPAKPLGAAIEQFVEEAVSYESGELETMSQKIEAQTKVLAAIATALNSRDQAVVAKLLGLKPAPDPE
jgi:hypothetical protein